MNGIWNIYRWNINKRLKEKSLVDKSDISGFIVNSNLDKEIQPIYRYFKKICNSSHISAWNSKGLPDERIWIPAISINGLAPALNYISTKSQLKFDGSCLKQDKVGFTHEKVVVAYPTCEINLGPFTGGKDFTLGNYLLSWL